MRFLHLSDLHIGRRLSGLSLLGDQRVVLSQILSMAADCDAVLLAGDLFDKYQPSADSLQLVSELLVSLSRKGKPVLAISGNHDNPEQLAYCRELLSDSGVFIAPAYDGTLRCHTLRDAYGDVNIWLLPFVKPSGVRPYAAGITTYDEAVRTAISRAQIDLTQRNVLLAHQFVGGAALCESETRAVGGLDMVGADAFDGFDYVALGHLHSPQRLMGGRICYAGSPLKYSLSEERQRKAALMVTLGRKGELSVDSLPFAPPRDLRILRGTLQQLADQQSDDYIYAVLTDEEALLDPIGSLRLSYPHLLGMRVENSQTSDNAVFVDIQEAETLSPLEHFVAFYRAQHNDQPPSDKQLALLREIIEQAQEVQHAAYTD